MPPLVDLEVEAEAPAPAKEELACCIDVAAALREDVSADGAALLVLDGAEADWAVIERGSNLDALSAAEEDDGRASILCLLAAGESFDVAGTGAARDGAEAGAETAAADPFWVGACLLSCCAVRF